MSTADAPAIFFPLALSLAATLCTVVLHAFAVLAIIRFVRREQRLGVTGVSFQRDLVIVASAIVLAFGAHLLEIALWGVGFALCGEFHGFAAAFYHSAENYTTLGYGDLVMSAQWKLLGPLEAADGMLMFGVSTAVIFAVIQRLVEARYSEG
jgi:hypothetical protein